MVGTSSPSSALSARDNLVGVLDSAADAARKDSSSDPGGVPECRQSSSTHSTEMLGPSARFSDLRFASRFGRRGTDGDTGDAEVDEFERADIGSAAAPP
jgi:hypothetical protein